MDNEAATKVRVMPIENIAILVVYHHPHLLTEHSSTAMQHMQAKSFKIYVILMTNKQTIVVV